MNNRGDLMVLEKPVLRVFYRGKDDQDIQVMNAAVTSLLTSISMIQAI